MKAAEVWMEYNFLRRKIHEYTPPLDGYIEQDPVQQFLGFFFLVIHEDIEEVEEIRDLCGFNQYLIMAVQNQEDWKDGINRTFSGYMPMFMSRWEKIDLYFCESVLIRYGVNTGKECFAQELLPAYMVSIIRDFKMNFHQELVDSVTTYTELFLNFLDMVNLQKEKTVPDVPAPRLRAIALAQYYKFICSEGVAITENNCNDVANQYSLEKASRRLYQIFLEYADRSQRLMSRGTDIKDKNHHGVFEEAISLLVPESESFKRAREEKQTFELNLKGILYN